MEQEQPVQPEYKAMMEAIARVIDGEFNPAGQPKKTGFALLVFPFGQPNGEHRCNYMSNARRDDMLATMKEFIARAEGTFQDSNKGVN